MVDKTFFTITGAHNNSKANRDHPINTVFDNDDDIPVDRFRVRLGHFRCVHVIMRHGMDDDLLTRTTCYRHPSYR